MMSKVSHHNSARVSKWDILLVPDPGSQRSPDDCGLDATSRTTSKREPLSLHCCILILHAVNYRMVRPDDPRHEMRLWEA
jgi:hypothetical protein